MEKFQIFVFYLLVFFLPSQLAYHFWPDYSFVFGIRVDYLAPAIYFTDLLVLTLLVTAKTKIKLSWLFVICLFAICNILVSVSPWVSFWKWMKILEIAYLIKYISEHVSYIENKLFVKVLSVRIVFFSLIGIAQFLKGGTLGGMFYFLGERNFNINTPGTALQEINGQNYLRAYSTFPHPNSFAGYLLLAFPLVSGFPRFLGIISFFLTFSLSALIAGISAFRLKKFIKLIFFLVIFGSLLLTFIKNNSTYLSEISERLSQYKLSGELISKNFIFGTGLNTFVIKNPDLQPVHNVFLLVFSETGVVGFLLLLYLVLKLINQKSTYGVLIILVVSFFDHYFFTLQQNLLLVAFVIGATLNGSKKLKLVNG